MAIVCWKDFIEFIDDGLAITGNNMMFAQNGMYCFKNEYDRECYILLCEELLKVLKAFRNNDWSRCNFEAVYPDVRRDWARDVAPLMRSIDAIKIAKHK